MKSSLVQSAAIFLSLGLDTFAVAVSVGVGGLPRREQLRFGASFAFAEGTMPLVGFLVGQGVAHLVGKLSGYLAVALLFGVGAYVICESRQENEREYHPVSPLKLALLALSVSLDELAIGFSLGLLHVPIFLAAALIAAQALVVTTFGITLGSRIGERFADSAEFLSGLALAGLAFFLLAEKVAGA